MPRVESAAIGDGARWPRPKLVEAAILEFYMFQPSATAYRRVFAYLLHSAQSIASPWAPSDKFVREEHTSWLIYLKISASSTEMP